MKFSKKTIAHLSSAVASSIGHQQIAKLFYEFDLEKLDQPAANKDGRALALLKGVQALPEEEAWKATIEIADRCVGTYYWSDILLASLRLDGFEVIDGQLIPTTPGPVSLAPAVSAFEKTLMERGMTVAVKHYRQAIDNFTDSTFEAANSQVRSAVEALLPALSKEATGNEANSPAAALQQLNPGTRLI